LVPPQECEISSLNVRRASPRACGGGCRDSGRPPPTARLGRCRRSIKRAPSRSYERGRCGRPKQIRSPGCTITGGCVHCTLLLCTSCFMLGMHTIAAMTPGSMHASCQGPAAPPSLAIPHARKGDAAAGPNGGWTLGGPDPTDGGPSAVPGVEARYKLQVRGPPQRSAH
jgi:hypothetical protein